MLPSDLLMYQHRGDTLTPKRLPLDDKHRQLAEAVIRCFEQQVGKTQGELDRELKEFEGDRSDYRLIRGLAHLLRQHYATFEVVSPIEPSQLRERVFRTAAQRSPIPTNRLITLEILTAELGRELNTPISIQDIEDGLYADLKENQRLTNFEAPTPLSLLHRYNLSQVQGVFYKASEIVIHARRNNPGEYKLLFRYLKFFQLMVYVEGDADTGFTLTIDGPTSLFKANTRYGLSLAKLIPALLHVSHWELTAQLHYRDPYSKAIRVGQYTLSDRSELVSHYKPDAAYDSSLEASFAKRWQQLNTPWILEREVDLIPLPGGAAIPDFRLVHPDGRAYLLEIVGYWRPEYLRKKFYQLRHVQAQNFIVAISERLNLEKAGIKLDNVMIPIVWFKTKLAPKNILAQIEPEQ